MARGSGSAPAATAIEVLRGAAEPLTGGARDYDGLLELIGDSPVVLLGEATHGTSEFYRERARITQRLVETRGFTAVAVEADWPDAYRVNRYVRGVGPDASARESLDDFRRFPLWMWRNRDVLALVEYLRDHNAALSRGTPRVGFYGLDLYSLHSSIDAVIRYLDEVDPESAARARYRYGCFDHFGEDTQAYGYAAEFGLSGSCEEHALEQLLELRRRAGELASDDGVPEDDYFYAEQNARLVANAEAYYRSMFRGRVESWNLRDRHMADTLAALYDHLGREGAPAKVVVWEHNSHIGDARATAMGDEGEWNVGQLARERFGDGAILVGFTTYAGSVTAADDWGEPARRMRVTPARPDSYEHLLHNVGLDAFVLPLRSHPDAADVMADSRLERAIGVIYRPKTERVSHYFEARMADQFDAVVHFDQTTAVEPLDLNAGWSGEDAPETFPSAL